MQGARQSLLSKGLALAVGLLLLVTVAAVTLQVMRRPKPMVNKVIIGTKDEVYYSLAATMQEATDLGHALEKTGFFADRGASVQLTKHKGVVVISFVLNNGAWERPEAVFSFEEIGRLVAGTVGFPIEIDLVDAAWKPHRRLTVGKLMVSAKDAVYYFGSATEADAKALGQALHDAGYLQNLGATVTVSKGNGSVIGFVVGDGVWDRPDAVAGFERLTRQVAGSVGGLPVKMQLLSGQMEVKKAADVL